MDKRKVHIALKTCYILAVVLTLVWFVLRLAKDATVETIPDDILSFTKEQEILLSFVVHAIMFIIPLIVSEYGIYSALRYLQIEEKSSKGRFIWKITMLLICLAVFAERIGACIYVTKIYGIW